MFAKFVAYFCTDRKFGCVMFAKCVAYFCTDRKFGCVMFAKCGAYFCTDRKADVFHCAKSVMLFLLTEHPYLPRSPNVSYCLY